MVQLIHNSVNQEVRLYIADLDSAYDITVNLTNMQTKDSTTQNVAILKNNSRYALFRLNLRGYEVGMYLMDLFQPQIDLGRHLVYLSYDADNPIQERPYGTYTTNPSPDVVYDG